MKGQYDFASYGYDGLTQPVPTAGIRCLYILDYGNSFYTNNTAAWRNKVSAIGPRRAQSPTSKGDGKYIRTL